LILQNKTKQKLPLLLHLKMAFAREQEDHNNTFTRPPILHVYSRKRRRTNAAAAAVELTTAKRSRKTDEAASSSPVVRKSQRIRGTTTKAHVPVVAGKKKNPGGDGDGAEKTTAISNKGYSLRNASKIKNKNNNNTISQNKPRKRKLTPHNKVTTSSSSYYFYHYFVLWFCNYLRK